MSAVVIVGAQWGDEGKGKVVDLFTEHADMVVRYAGGANAGHTLFVGDGNQKVVMRLVPSGVLRPGVRCVLGQGMVIDPEALLSELDELAGLGRDAAADLVVSERAHLIFPYHKLVDGLRESGAKAGEAIGTTRRGIGPAYEDKAGRRGVTAGDLRSPARVREMVGKALEAWAPTIRALGGEVPTVEAAAGPALAAAPRVIAMLGDASRSVNDAIRQGKRVMLEGAQGTLLDLDHGTYPFVTSSSSVAGGACTGVGVGPSRISSVVGITKAYTTRVGSGPFPTELLDATGDRIRQAGGEFGSVTGRPRRCGWLDLPALRYAAQVNGLDGLAITKLDELKVCVGYRTAAGESPDFPIDYLDHEGGATPIFESVAGWAAPLGDARKLEDLPRAARDYVRLIEERAGVTVCLVSVGPRRSETILIENPFVKGK
jgi:adenylosuccinate synthase